MENVISSEPGLRLPGILAAILFLAGPAPLLTITPQSTTTVSTSSDSRKCSANPVLTLNKKFKSYKKSRHPIPADPPPACIEMKGQPIEIQEFLQSVARDLKWRIGDNHASEVSWTFVRYLNDDELAKYSDTKVLVEPVVFTSGKAAIIVRTTELSEGFARVQIATHIQGDGKSTDQISAQPGTSWPLGSKGVLEGELLSALQSGYKRKE
jgi:hypothetical protein